MKFILILGLSLSASTPVFSQTPYSGMQTREVKALSNQQAADLQAGRGMGLALAAELNGYIAFDAGATAAYSGRKMGATTIKPSPGSFLRIACRPERTRPCRLSARSSWRIRRRFRRTPGTHADDAASSTA